MNSFDVIISNVSIADGTGSPLFKSSVGIIGDKIQELGDLSNSAAKESVDGEGLVLSPGFIDVHTHDDLNVIRNPEMKEKITQGVTTVIVGNCGISASPATLRPEFDRATPPDPMNLLGRAREFAYSKFADYVSGVNEACPAVNVAALVGHTTLRNTHMERLDREASSEELKLMAKDLISAMEAGAIGMSSGLAYANAMSAPKSEVSALVSLIQQYHGIYTTHLRTEFEGILDAMDEAFETAKKNNVDLVISHLKCAGKENWGRSKEVLEHLTNAEKEQVVACDCYPYSASSSTLDLEQVTDDTEIFITWSESEPDYAGRNLKEISGLMGLSLHETAKKLMPAGAVYHCMSEDDVENIMSHPNTMIGSDGLPCDPHPHPRLWGCFPRVLNHYTKSRELFELPTAVRKMTGLSAEKFHLDSRGLIKEGYFADLVLFDPEQIKDMATFQTPCEESEGIHGVWVNGVRSYQKTKVGNSTFKRAGRFIKRSA